MTNLRQTEIADLGRMLDDLVNFSQGLVNRFNDSEPHFLRIADELEHLSEVISTTHQNCLKLVEEESGHLNNQNVVSTSMDLIRNTLVEADSLNTKIAQTLVDLKSMDGLADVVLRNESRLKMAIAPFTIVRMLFKIHSAPLPPEDRQVFSTLSEELEKLDQSVRKVFLDQFRNLHKLRSTLTDLLPEIDASTREVQGIIEEQQGEMLRALTLLDQKIEAGKGTTQVLDQSSKDLQHQFSQLIMGTQFHDIIRQRLEHVSSASSQMRELFQSTSSGNSEGDWETLGHFLQKALEIQNRQIETLYTRLDESENTIRSGVTALISTSEKVANEAIRFHDKASGMSSLDKVIVALNTLFASLATVMETSKKCSVSAHEAVLPLKSMVSDMTGVLNSISIEIQLIALNSQVKAAQISVGTGLDVLSAKTREISSEILTLNSQLAADLSKLSSVFSSSLSALEACASTIDHSSHLFSTEKKTAAHSLESLQKGVQSRVSPISQSHVTIEKTAQSILQELQFREKLSTDISQFPALKDKTLTLLQGLIRAKALPDRSIEQLELLRKNYTMAEEHSIHNDVVGIVPANDSLSKIPTVKGAIDVEFNLDLPNNSEASPSAPLSDNVELF